MADIDTMNPVATLAEMGDEEGPSPTYMGVASIHTLLNTYQSNETSWDESLANGAKMAISAMVSGVDSLANTAISTSNFFGQAIAGDGFATVDPIDTASQLMDIDSDLGKYYMQNKHGADIAGFLLTSIIPGIGGTKVLNAGQKFLSSAKWTGLVGETAAGWTGLLVPKVDMYFTKAAAEIAQSRVAFSGINANMTRGLLAGFGQATLESAAFETAVALTMNQSPVLEDQDIGDMTTNILMGGALGGVIGGVVQGVKLSSRVKAFVKEANIAEKPWTEITALPKGTSAVENVIQHVSDIEHMPVVEQGTEYTAKHTDLADTKVRSLRNKIRTQFRSISSDDDIGNMVTDASTKMGTNETVASYFGVEDLVRVGQKTKVEKAIEAESKILIDLDNPVLPVDSGNRAVKFVRLMGKDIGNTFDEVPATLYLADRYESANAISTYVSRQSFKIKDGYSALTETNHMRAEARQYWADKVVNLKPGTVVGDYDIPLITKAYDKGIPITMEVSKVTLKSPEDFIAHLTKAKQEVTKAHINKGKLSTEEVSKIADVTQTSIEGNYAENSLDDLFAKKFRDKQYTEQMIANGRSTPPEGVIDTHTLPKYAKMGIDYKSLTGVDGNLLNGMAYIATRSKLLSQDVANVFAKQVGQKFINRFPDITSFDITNSNSFGAGPGRFSFANGNYGSFEAKVEAIGAATSDLINEFKASTRATMEPLARALANHPEAAVEFQVLNEKVASINGKYVMNAEGTGLIHREYQKYLAMVEDGKNPAMPTIQKGAPLEIPIKHQETLDAVQAHINLNGQRVSNLKEIYAAQGGLSDAKDALTFYPMRPDPNEYKHFAFVHDSRVTGVGHMSMVHATSASDLAKLLERVPPEFTKITDRQSKAWHEALGDYKWDRTLHENYIDSSMKSAGVNSQFFIKTDPMKIAQDWMESHLRRDAVHARELVNAKYDTAFAELQSLGENYTNIATSQYASRWEAIAKTTKNPYMDYVKTALNVSRTDEFPLLQSLNKVLSNSVGAAYESLLTAFAKTKSAADLDSLQGLLDKHGIQSAFNHDSIADMIVNKNITKDAASKFVRGANKILSTVALRLDWMNAATNAIGANVLLGTETNYLVKQIRAANPKAAGALTQIMDIQVPGVADTIRSPSKLIGNAGKAFFSNDPALKAEKEMFRQMGLMPSLDKQMGSLLEDLTVTGEDTVATLNGRLDAAYSKAKDWVAKGEKITGNVWAEDFNRYVAAKTIKQITDIAVEHGIIGAADAPTYWHTFVNRTQGNTLATQRPMLFQGPVGQAVGLFQTYQFNMIQQMLRYVAEGSGKDVAMLAGLQATMFGINGLPAFNFINTHIVGTASGNTQHTDMYAGVYGVAGKTMGDWLLYGAPSNLLHTNFYSRGDINPRQLTVIPTNPADVPIVNATGAFFGNLYNMTKRIANGGAIWGSILQGIEHNTISRPLAGLAQTLEAFDNPSMTSYSTTSKGNILGSNDFFSLVNFARIAGGKPLGESVLNDAMFRTTVYSSKDRDRKNELGEALKTQGAAGKTIEPEKMTQFLGEYVKLGGTQKQFNKWALGQLTGANSEKANLMVKKLQTPTSKYLQNILTGNEFGNLSKATKEEASGE